MSLSFLGKKSFHPSNPKNLQKLYAAEEKKKADEKKKAELEEQFKIDRDRAELRATNLVWPPLLRKLDRELPGYRS